MSERMEFIKEQLIKTREYVNSVLDQVGDRWEMQVYSDGLQWTVRQVVVHIVDANQSHNLVLQNIANGRDIIPEDFDVERYNKGMTRKTAEKTSETARAELESALQTLMDWLETIDDATLDMKGRHASLNIMSIEEMLVFLPKHERKHTHDIAEALAIEI